MLYRLVWEKKRNGALYESGFTSTKARQLTEILAYLSKPYVDYMVENGSDWLLIET